MKKLILSALIASALAGCASFPDNYQKPLGNEDITAQKRDEWGDIPDVTFVQSKGGIAVRKYNEIPAAVREKVVNLSFDAGTKPTVSDVVFALSAQGFRLISRLDDDTMKKEFTTRSFQGNAGELLNEISDTYNVAYEYRNGAVYLVESNKFSASLPQHKDFMANVEKALKELGATETRSDVLSGQVYYRAKPDVAEYVAEYLDTIAKNAAMVKLQVAVLTVSMNRDVNLGFDWAKLAVQRGSGGMTSELGNIFNNGTNTGAGTGTNTGTGSAGSNGSTGSNTANNGTTGNTGSTGTGSVVTDTAKKLVTGSLASFIGSDGFGYKFANDAFSLTAALKALSTYGNARTEQNVVLSTLSGLQVKISSGDDIPYVKSIGSATAAGGATTGSSQTDVIKSGLKLDVTPQFDSSDGSLVTQVKVDMSTLVGFRELSAGQNLGTMSQPQMKNLGFENFGRLMAGETIIVGGITYDQLSNNYTNFPGMEKMAMGSKAEKVTRNAIYIVIRPTVLIFTPKANEYNAKLLELRAQREAEKAAGETAKKSEVR